MRRSTMFAVVGSLVVACGVQAGEKGTDKPGVKKPAEAKPKVVADEPVKKQPSKTDGKKPGALDEKAKFKKEAAKATGGPHKGRVERISVDGDVLTLTVDGKPFEFRLTDATVALLKTRTQDDKQIVVGLQLFNADAGAEKVAQKEPTKTVKEPGVKSPEAPKKTPPEKPAAKTPDKKSA